MKTMRLFSSLALGLALILLFAGCAGPAPPRRARRSRQAGQCPGRQPRLSGASRDTAQGG